MKHIRENNSRDGAKTNTMIHNFWGFNYIVQRIKDVANELILASRRDGRSHAIQRRNELEKVALASR